MTTPHPGDDRLIDYALAELQAGDRGSVETHLEQCNDCRKVVATLSTIVQSAQVAHPPEPPARLLVDLLQAQADARSGPSPRITGSNRFATAAAAVVLIGVIFAGGFFTGRQATTPSSPVRSGVDTLRVVRPPLPEPPEIPFQTAHASDSANP